MAKFRQIVTWENAQYLVLFLTVVGQILIGANYYLGQGVWLVSNAITVSRNINVPSEFAAKSIEGLLQNYYYQRGAKMIPQDRFKGIDFDFKSMWHDECINSAIKSIIRMN